MNALVQKIEQEYMKAPQQIPEFRAGDTVRVAVRIVEGDKERIQNFDGVVIGRHGSGMNETFTVRRVSFGVGMERVFSLHSPRVESITVTRRGHVRRSKLYYLRELSGKKARISESRRKRPTTEALVAEEVVAETAEQPGDAEQAIEASVETEQPAEEKSE